MLVHFFGHQQTKNQKLKEKIKELEGALSEGPLLNHPLTIRRSSLEIYTNGRTNRFEKPVSLLSVVK